MPNTFFIEQESDVHRSTSAAEPAEPDIRTSNLVDWLEHPEQDNTSSEATAEAAAVFNAAPENELTELAPAVTTSDASDPSAERAETAGVEGAPDEFVHDAVEQQAAPEQATPEPNPEDETDDGSLVELMVSYEPGTNIVIDAAIKYESEFGTTVIPAIPENAFAAAEAAVNAQTSAADDEEEQEWIHGDLDEDDDDIDDNVNDTSSVAFQRREEELHAPDPTPVEVVRKNFTVIAAVVAGVLVSCVKFLASFFTGSVAMFSEGIHSLVDATNDSLLLVGTRASKKKPDIEHPFGFGREVYFYTFVVSVVIFFFGGGFTIYRGLTSLIAGGTVVENPIVNYLVLGIGIVLEGFSFCVALRDVNRTRDGQPLFDYIRESKSPTKFTVLLEDTAAELGMIIAFAGIFFSLLLDIPQLDSIASIIIGALMAAIAIILLRETRSLLIGEGLTRDEIEDVVFIVESDPSVIKCGRVMSLYMGPHDMLLTLDVTFDDELDEGDVLQAIDRIEAELVDDFPQCTSIFVEVESLNQVYRQRHDRKQQFEAEKEDEEDEERERELERERAIAKAKKRAKKRKKKDKAKAKQRVEATAAIAEVETKHHTTDSQ